MYKSHVFLRSQSQMLGTTGLSFSNVLYYIILSYGFNVYILIR